MCGVTITRRTPIWWTFTSLTFDVSSIARRVRASFVRFAAWATRSENNVFQAARWRLTLSFTLALGAILVVTAVATYAATSAVVYGQVDRELRGRAASEQLVVRPQFSGRESRPFNNDLKVGP